MKKRDFYLHQLISFQDKPLIKVITGIRRCGKSTLLALYEEYLLETGIPADQIIRLDFESLEYDEVTGYKQLYAYVSVKMSADRKRSYLLLDEVQQVESWEKAVNSFLVDFNVDICITGSNAHLLSSELSTRLSGRYVEIKMQPLSFGEYLEFHDYAGVHDLPALFNEYLKYGGLPAVVELKDHPETIAPFLTGICHTVMIKDIVQRHNVRDVALLERVLKFIAANTGNLVSAKKISDYLTSSGRKTTSETIDNYLKMLENAFIIYRASRYDLKGKQLLKTMEKYYMVDIGLRNQLTGLQNTDFGQVLENIVYLELLRRGYSINIGKIGSLEVDFVATRPDKIAYYQVAVTIMDSYTRMRELRPLMAIDDNYEKVILTMDKTIYPDFNGICNINIIDFLLNADDLGR